MDPPRKSTSSRNIISRPSVHTYSKLSLDPKNFSEKQYQLQIQREIIQFFQENCSDVPITIKHLQTPNTKDYILVFTTLMRLIDPLFELTGKMEDEIPALLKALGYPFTVSKNSLLAVGAPNSWPSLLASLSWLVDALRVSFPPVEVVNKDQSHQIALKAYEMFLTTHDFSEELNEMIRLLEANFNENNEKLEELANVIKNLSDEKERLVKVKSRFENAESMIAKNKSAIFSIKSVCAGYVANIKEHEERLNYLAGEKEKLKKDLEEVNSKNAEIAKIVEIQPYSVDDMERVRSEIISLDQACLLQESTLKQTRDSRMKAEKHLSELEAEYISLFEDIVASCESHPYLKEQLGEAFSSNTLHKSISEQNQIIQNLNEKLSKISYSIMDHINNEITKKKEEDKELIETIKKLSDQDIALEHKLQERTRHINEAITKENFRKNDLNRLIKEQIKTLKENEEEVKKIQESIENKKVNLKIIQNNIEKAQIDLNKMRENFKTREIKSNAEVDEAYSTLMKIVEQVNVYKANIRRFMESQKNDIIKIHDEYFNSNDRFK